MVIYMRHPIHGTKVAVDEEEAKQDEKLGWKRFQVGALLTPEEAPEIHVAAIGFSTPASEGETHEREVWAARYAERFGKKPHHKKTVETLKRELEAA